MPDHEKSSEQTVPSLSDAIERLMANPEIISMVASAMGSSPLSAQSENTQSENTQKEETKAVTAVPSSPDIGNILSALSPIISGFGRSGDKNQKEGSDSAHNREALLYALRPYISQGRREAIDYILQLSRVSELLKQVK